MRNTHIKYIQTLFVVLPMTLIMAAVAITRQHGFDIRWTEKVFNSWLVMFPVAYISAFVIIPMAAKASAKLVRNGKVE